MDPHGPVGAWRLTTADGRVFDETRCPWPQLPPEIAVTRLDIGSRYSFTGYQGYGWQRYMVFSPTGGGARVAGGWQVLGLVGDWVVVTDVNEITGRCEVSIVPGDKLTYARELLRAGGG